ncbi:AbrB/MazE/SpoVT family DNA-binding domain-containing protein (plasmid) [Limosilactobacillus reuteri]|uniref:AbrB/MazE/SpoVT family DNA-binding domain-containing protein n=1 Tax=Limosilactobacillus reuteri TaxID=1598 RepID=A0A517D8B1_LIMRT|nr:type II toxin-antitoxin system PrlF family antitoxin [Limosilactobacillus reuteri]QDR73593.1 AbrB/MazE/SpoVT family DNA-binding domain-containing protein [Limosilactobacillus reuteri]
MEQEAISTITAKNQTTIPRAVRRKLNLVPGDQLSYVIKSDGNVSIKKVKPKTDKMWQIAYQQEKKYGSFDTPEVDWGPDIESEEFD